MLHNDFKGPVAGDTLNQWVDKDGDPVRWQESTDIILVNERGERVPVIMEENGTISLPTRDEVAIMRANGQVQNADFKDLPPEMTEAILKTRTEGGPSANDLQNCQFAYNF